MRIEDQLAALTAQIGKPRGPTAWREVLQSDVTDFGRSTYDPDPMHVDPDWARQHSPFGGTIAFGFWTVSMLTCFWHELQGGSDGGDYGIPHEQQIGINYGFERLRFIQPVPVGSRIRMRAMLEHVERKGPDRLLLTTNVSIEIEGEDKPALAARWLSMMLYPEADTPLDGFRPAATGGG